MAQAYLAENMGKEAVFSLFVRRLPRNRNYLLACGLDDVLAYLEEMQFDAEAIEYLDSLGMFKHEFLEWLGTFRFSGDVFAVPEGTVVFANEPILEVSGPIAEAQIVETFIMNQVHLQTTLASKAARVVTAARGRSIVDFGPRRMHGVDAALKAARAFHIAGVTATSNVYAGKIYGVTATGTMAHSFVQAWDQEADAFRAFARCYPGTILLVDTYDTVRGVERVCELARQLGESFRIRGVRLDSGDLVDLAFQSRKILDAAGLNHVEIFASSSLDEHAIDAILSAGAPIDGFGVGTKMGVSEDAPSLDIAYKLCAYGGEGRLKTSTGKPVLPGRKQVFRNVQDERACGDVITRADEQTLGRPMLEQVMAGGRRVNSPRVSLDQARENARRQIEALPDQIRALAPAVEPYPVSVSDRLRADQQRIIRTMG